MLGVGAELDRLIMANVYKWLPLHFSSISTCNCVEESLGNAVGSFCIIEGPETVQDFAQLQLQEIRDNIKSRRNKIFLLMEEPVAPVPPSTALKPPHTARKPLLSPALVPLLCIASELTCTVEVFCACELPLPRDQLSLWWFDQSCSPTPLQASSASDTPASPTR
ncbi:hypothetical protein L7F22_064252 [Adiantum nelumboides]|nr:hypothetical protein [Adiantum nelumboides]